MALSYNLGYQESISVPPTSRQNFAGKVYSNFPNIWEWVVLYARDIHETSQYSLYSAMCLLYSCGCSWFGFVCGVDINEAPK